MDKMMIAISYRQIDNAAKMTRGEAREIMLGEIIDYLVEIGGAQTALAYKWRRLSQNN
jgi:hypothetical protein